MLPVYDNFGGDNNTNSCSVVSFVIIYLNINILIIRIGIDSRCFEIMNSINFK